MNTIKHGAESGNSDMPSKAMRCVSAAFTPKSAATLRAHPAMSGHAGTGGLQKHSVGDDYPLTIVGTQAHADAPTQWYVMDLCTGNKGQVRNTYKEAKIDLTSLKVRNMMHG